MSHPVFIRLDSLTSPECLSLWIQRWNFLVICFALTYNGTLLLIRELLLGTIYHSEWVFFGMVENTLWQGINSSFYPIPLTGWRSHSLSAKWLSSLLFHPCFPPILHTRAWVRESDTSEGEKEGEGDKDGGEKLGEKEGQMGTCSRRKEERGVDQYFRETSNPRRCGLPLPPPPLTRQQAKKNGD